MNRTAAANFNRNLLALIYRFPAGLVPVLLIAALTYAGTSFGAQPDFDKVASWGYQLTGYEDGGLDKLIDSPFELLVIDLARDGESDFFSAKDINSLKKSDKIVIAYFEIGAIEDYRPEWNSVPKEIMAGAVDDWPKEQYVKYWDNRWWPIVQSRIDQALAAGFDGIYLDLITAYDEIPDSDLSSEERARRMVALIAKISKYAKSKQADFKIIAQNCPELASWSFWEPKPNDIYLNAIDGLAIESPFYVAHDNLCKEDWCQENRNDALFVKSQGKLLLGVDYAKQAQSIRDSYSRQRNAGFVPYVSVRALDRLIIHEESLTNSPQRLQQPIED